MGKKIRAFIGYGMGGSIVGPALALGDGPAEIARKLYDKGVETSMQRWKDTQQIYDAIQKLSSDYLIVLIGTSLSANQTPLNARYAAPRKIDLICGIQPSKWGPRNTIPANVKRAVCFYNPIDVLTGGLGAYAWSRESSNKTTVLYTYRYYVGHPGDNVDWVQDTIVKHVLEVANQTV